METGCPAAVYEQFYRELQTFEYNISNTVKLAVFVPHVRLYMNKISSNTTSETAFQGKKKDLHQSAIPNGLVFALFTCVQLCILTLEALGQAKVINTTPIWSLHHICSKQCFRRQDDKHRMWVVPQLCQRKASF